MKGPIFVFMANSSRYMDVNFFLQLYILSLDIFYDLLYGNNPDYYDNIRRNVSNKRLGYILYYIVFRSPNME